SVCWLSWLTLGAGHPLAAQKQTGTIVGEVRDAASGADIEGARVLVEATGRVSVTSRSGGFTIAGLAPGPYRLRVAAVGHRLRRRDRQPGAHAAGRSSRAERRRRRADLRGAPAPRSRSGGGGEGRRLRALRQQRARRGGESRDLADRRNPGDRSARALRCL